MKRKPFVLFAMAAAALGIALGAWIVTGPVAAAPLPQTNLPAAQPTARFLQLSLPQLDAEQRPLGEQIMKVSSLGLGGPYNAMLRSPVMGERLFEMLDYLRFQTSLPHRLNEFAILIQARLWTSQVIWLAHYPAALKAGLEPSVADQLKAGRRPAGMKPDEAAVYDFCTELSVRHRVSDATFRRARQFLSERQVADLIAVSGTYVTIAMLIRAPEQPVPPGKTPPLAPLAAPLPVR